MIRLEKRIIELAPETEIEVSIRELIENGYQQRRNYLWKRVGDPEMEIRYIKGTQGYRFQTAFRTENVRLV